MPRMDGLTSWPDPPDQMVKDPNGLFTQSEHFRLSTCDEVTSNALRENATFFGKRPSAKRPQQLGPHDQQDDNEHGPEQAMWHFGGYQCPDDDRRYGAQQQVPQ